MQGVATSLVSGINIAPEVEQVLEAVEPSGGGHIYLLAAPLIRYFKVCVALVLIGEQLQNTWALPTAGNIKGIYIKVAEDKTCPCCS